MSDALDEFGRLVMEQLRDKALESADRMLNGDSKAPRMRQLQADLDRLTDEERAVARRLVGHVIDAAVHDFLFGLDEACNARWISIRVHGEDIAAETDGLQGEPFGERGWQARFSRYGRAPDGA